MARIKLTETALLSVQNAMHTGDLSLDQLDPVFAFMDKAGYYSCEVWGRKSYQSSMLFLNEDPWDRLREIKKRLPNVNLQLTFAGQYLLSNAPLADDVVTYFIARALAAGIDILRVFDPMNDLQNLKTSMTAIRGAGVHLQAGIVYTTSDIHGRGLFVNYAKQLEDLGADSICLIDEAGLLTPYATYELIASLKQELSIPVQFSTSGTTGTASMNIIKAVEAGVDLLDTTTSAFSGGVSHPSTEGTVRAFASSPYDSGLDLKNLYPVEEFFIQLKESLMDANRLSSSSLLINQVATKAEIPVEMLDFLLAQLNKEQYHQIPLILEEVHKVREDAGTPPLINPIDEIIMAQALYNLSTQNRYEKTHEGFLSLLKGELGRTPASINPIFKDTILTGEGEPSPDSETTTTPQLDTLRSQLPQKYNEQEEDILTLVQFPALAPKYFEDRSNRLYGLDGRHSDELKQVHPI